MNNKIAKLIFIFLLCLSFSNVWATLSSSEVTGTSDGEAQETYVVSKLKFYFSDKNALQKSGSASSVKPTREITLLLREAVQNFDSYSEDAQQYLSMFLLRPDSTANNWPWVVEPIGKPDFYLPEPVLPYDSPNGKFRFWYVTHDTPDGNGVVHTTTLSDVQAMATVFENVYTKTVTTMGYPDPPNDSAISPNGGDSKMDIYVMDCGYYGVYGYTASEGSGSSQPSFMVMDNDFVGFPTAPQDAMKVTAAHEYHHVVQFGINSQADAWIMEATATWMEDQIYDDINDNLQYLNDGANSFFKNPEISLDLSQDPFWYGKWIWLEYMETKWDQAVVKNIWLDYLSKSGSGVDAITDVLLDEVLLGEDTSLRKAFTEFATWNYVQSELDGVTLYRDASLYDSVNIANAQSTIGYNLDYSSASSDIFTAQTLSVDHLAAKYFKLTPGSSITESQNDTLTVYIKGTTDRRVDVVPVIKSAGGLYTKVALSLDNSNYGKIEIANFNRSDVSEVVLVLINYSINVESSSILVSGGIGTDGIANTGGAEPAPTIPASSSSGGCFIGTIH